MLDKFKFDGFYRVTLNDNELCCLDGTKIVKNPMYLFSGYFRQSIVFLIVSPTVDLLST